MPQFFSLVLPLAGLYASFVHSTFVVTPTLPLSFMFSWGDTSLPFPVPVTEQCETLNINWSRGTATGPNPTAPYYLQIYTSNYIQPFVIPAGDGLSFNFTVPFAPGTIYQICMFDKFGYTGGCQEFYTVIAPSTLATCANMTFAPQLTVNGLVDNGPISQYGFVDQCTDISLTPINGTPPYTMTIAPDFHLPYNITSFDTPINWTVSINEAMAFFISLADSNGSLWSYGPLHASTGGTIGCLAGNVTTSRNVTVPVAVGVSFLVLFIGAFLGGVGLLILAKRRSNAFKKLPYPKPETLWGNVAAARQSLQPEAVNPFQLSMPRDDEEAARNQVFYRNMKGLDRLPYINTERPPSYPEYFPSETHDINRELGRERELSPSTTTIVLDRMSVTRSTTLDRSGRHYDPRGPLTLSQPRISKSLPKTPFIRSIAGPAP